MNCPFFLVDFHRLLVVGRRYLIYPPAYTKNEQVKKRVVGEKRKGDFGQDLVKKVKVSSHIQTSVSRAEIDTKYPVWFTENLKKINAGKNKITE